MSLLNYSNPFFPPGPVVPQYYNQQTTPQQNNQQQQQQPLLYGPASRQPFTQPPNKGYTPRSFTTTRRYDAYDDDDYDDEKKNYDDESYDDKYQANSKREADERVRTATETPAREQRNAATVGGKFPGRPIEYKRVRIERPKPPALHPIIDYDNDYYYEDDTGTPGGPAVRAPPLLAAPLHVTPIQGPIFLKNGTVPVVPLYAYPVINNGTFLQIPILWTALSVALGLELRGDIVRGVPCIKRYHQLFCPTAGNNYPIDRIELFIDENKALMKRMYGDFTMGSNYGPLSGRKRKRETAPGVPDLHLDSGPDPTSGGKESYFAKLRDSRQASSAFRNNQSSESGRVDACESKVEIVTPYWASNSAGKIRAIVNTQHFEQAIHQEVCSKTQTGRCSGDCGCEQKYKWHRLLAYDPDNDCKGIFMDWFLFPSCCVCRCNPT